MDKDKLKKIIIIGVIIIVVIISIISGVFYFKHISSTNFKLKKIGYNDQEITVINENSDIVDLALTEYNKNLVPLLSSKYFMRNRLNRYLEYAKNNENIEINRVVSIVNANMDKDIYTDVKTVFQNDNLVIVNRFYKLENAAIPDDLKNISIQYAYDGHQLKEEANNAYIKMARAARDSGITLIANVSYRSYDDQDATYNNFKSRYGVTKADELAARPGHSEHQTGLALNISTRLKEGQESFEETEAYSWLLNNAYKYGFIQRYPEGKEDITGFIFEPGHFRYVGIEVATQIYNENITFDEYYAYYLENSIKWGETWKNYYC